MLEMNLEIKEEKVFSPSSFQVDFVPIEGEALRNADGKTFKDRIAIKRVLNVTWGSLYEKDVSKILNLTKEVFFNVTYPDPMEGSMVTKTFYIDKQTTPFYDKDNAGNNLWKGLSITFTEQ